jgi:uncharacterized protein YdaT
MAWTTGDYPIEMQALEPDVRAKAIKIANELLQEGYQDYTAVTVAISRAKMSAREADQSSHENDLHVVTHNTGWAIRREQAPQGSFLFSDFETRQQARAKAAELGRYEGVSVVVHAEDDEVIEYFDPSQSS